MNKVYNKKNFSLFIFAFFKEAYLSKFWVYDKNCLFPYIINFLGQAI